MLVSDKGVSEPWSPLGGSGADTMSSIFQNRTGPPQRAQRTFHDFWRALGAGPELGAVENPCEHKNINRPMETGNYAFRFLNSIH